MAKDSAVQIEIRRSFHQLVTVQEKVSESDLMPLWDATTRHALPENPYKLKCHETSPGYVCNHGSLRERDAASPRFGNALCVTGSESAV